MSTTTFAYGGSYSNFTGKSERIDTPEPEVLTDADIEAMALEDPFEQGITRVEAAKRMVRNMKKAANYKTPLQKFDTEVCASLGLKRTSLF